jgi:hypothetical protein
VEAARASGISRSVFEPRCRGKVRSLLDSWDGPRPSRWTDPGRSGRRTAGIGAEPSSPDVEPLLQMDKEAAALADPFAEEKIALEEGSTPCCCLPSCSSSTGRPPSLQGCASSARATAPASRPSPLDGRPRPQYSYSP